MAVTSSSERGVLQGLKSLKISKYGVPFQKDTWDLIYSLALVLRPGTVKQRPFWKTHHNAFTGNDCVKCLELLTFLRSPERKRVRAADDTCVPIISTLKLPDEDAMQLMQHFIEARIIKDLTSSEYTPRFSKKAIYRFTIKGLMLIAEAIQLNGTSASETEHLSAALVTLPITRMNVSRDMRCRSSADDSFVVTKELIWNLFCRLTGDKPNYGVGDGTGVFLINHEKRNRLLLDLRALNGTVSAVSTTHCFEVAEMIQWLCTCTFINSEAEAAEFGAHFVRFGLIIAIPDTVPKKFDTSKIITVTDSSDSPWVACAQEKGQFVNLPKVIYAITDEGRLAPDWVVPQHGAQIQRRKPSTNTYTAHLSRQQSAAHYSEAFDEKSPNANRLRTILSDPVMRKQFQYFLSQSNFQHNVTFWMDMEDFKVEMARAAKGKAPARRPTMSETPVASSSSVPLQEVPQAEPPSALAALSERPFLMYNTYFSPQSTLGLRVEIGDDLAQELQELVAQVLDIATAKAMSESLEPSYVDSMVNMDQLQVLLELFERVQNRVFRNMTVRFVPEFLKSPEFMETRLAAAQSLWRGSLGVSPDRNGN